MVKYIMVMDRGRTIAFWILGLILEAAWSCHKWMFDRMLHAASVILQTPRFSQSSPDAFPVLFMSDVGSDKVDLCEAPLNLSN